MELISQDVKMDSRELADLTCKRHSDVMRDIRKESKALGSGEIAQRIFALSEYKDISGKVNPMYVFGKKGALQLALKYDAITRFKVIEKLEELENIKKPKSELELIIQSAQEIQRVEKKVEALENKFDSVVTLESGKQRLIQKAVAKRVYYRYENYFYPKVAEIKCIDSEIDKIYRSKLFSNIYRDLKNKFGVASYKDIKAVQFQDAINFIESWIEDADII